MLGAGVFENDPDFDPSLKVFQGQLVSLKFASKAAYDKKFLWVNLDARTFHMSRYQNKAQRHKEATL
jgi:hypothetical protein